MIVVSAYAEVSIGKDANTLILKKLLFSVLMRNRSETHKGERE